MRVAKKQKGRGATLISVDGTGDTKMPPPSPELEADTSNLVAIKGGGPPIEVLSVDSTRANAAHLEVMDLMRRYEETYFNIARVLHEMKQKKLYKALEGKFETFEDYVVRGVGIDFRKSKYLTKMWEWFGVEQEADPELLEGAHEIGWTKSKELVGVVTKKNHEKWYQLARELNAADLARAAKKARKIAEKKSAPPTTSASFAAKDENAARDSQPARSIDEGGEWRPTPPKVAEPKQPKPPQIATPGQPGQAIPGHYSDGGSADPYSGGVDLPEGLKEEVLAEKKDWHRFAFSIHKDSVQSVYDALEFAAELGASKHRGHLLSLICLNFCSGYDKQKSIVIGEWIAQFERLTGLSIIAMDERTETVAYGHEFLDRISGGDDKAEELEDGE